MHLEIKAFFWCAAVAAGREGRAVLKDGEATSVLNNPDTEGLQLRVHIIICNLVLLAGCDGNN